MLAIILLTGIFMLCAMTVMTIKEKIKGGKPFKEAWRDVWAELTDAND